MATVQSVIDRVLHITKDYDYVRWTMAELAGWLNDAVGQIATLHPRAAAKYVPLTLQEGSRQDLRTIDPSVRWIRLFELVCNMQPTTPGGTTYAPTGPTARMVLRSVLDQAFRTWRAKAATATAIEEYALDERQPYVFDVMPPVAAGTRVYALAAVKPAPCAALNQTGTALAVADEAFPLDDGYDIPAVDYVLFRAFSKDANDPTYAARAGNHLQAFQLAMGVEVKDASGA